jgi:hypothetical protein
LRWLIVAAAPAASRERDSACLIGWWWDPARATQRVDGIIEGLRRLLKNGEEEPITNWEKPETAKVPLPITNSALPPLHMKAQTVRWLAWLLIVYKYRLGRWMGT